MHLEPYNIGMYEPRKKILDNRKAEPMDYALLEIRQAYELVDEVISHDMVRHGKQHEALRNELTAIKESLAPMNPESASDLQKVLRHAEEAAESEGVLGRQQAQRFSAMQRALDKQVNEAYRVVLAATHKNLEAIVVKQDFIPGEPDDGNDRPANEPKRFANLALAHMKNASQILAGIADERAKDKVTEAAL